MGRPQPALGSFGRFNIIVRWWHHLRWFVTRHCLLLKIVRISRILWVQTFIVTDHGLSSRGIASRKSERPDQQDNLNGAPRGLLPKGNDLFA
jgi:hypothetical protein